MRGYNREQVLGYMTENDAELSSAEGMYSSAIYPNVSPKIYRRLSRWAEDLKEEDILAYYCMGGKLFDGRYGLLYTTNAVYYRAPRRRHKIEYVNIHVVDRSDEGLLLVWMIEGEYPCIPLPVISGWHKILLDMLRKDGSSIRLINNVTNALGKVSDQCKDFYQKAGNLFFKEIMDFGHKVMSSLNSSDENDEGWIRSCLMGMHGVMNVRMEAYFNELENRTNEITGSVNREALLQTLSNFSATIELTILKCSLMNINAALYNMNELTRLIEISIKRGNRHRSDIEGHDLAVEELDLTEKKYGCSREDARALEHLIGEQSEFDEFLGRKSIEMIELPA